MISNRVKANKQTNKQSLALSKPSVINSMLKDLISHEENIFKRFFFNTKILPISSKYLLLAAHAGALWASFDIYWVLRDGCDKCCIPTVIYKRWIFHMHTKNRTNREVPLILCRPSYRGQARSCTFFKLQPRAAIARPLPVSVHAKNWLRIPFNWLNKHLVCVSSKADHCIVSVMLWSPQWEQI